MNNADCNSQGTVVSRETTPKISGDALIKSFSRPQLLALMKEFNQPAFRAQQLYEWLYLHHVSSYDEMTTIPASLRATLALRYPLTTPSVIERQTSHDGTRKYLLSYHDGIRVETVAIPSHQGKRLTVCFSTQAGCAMSCAFCATGKEGFSRNLLPGEIVDQILVVQEDMGMRVTNIVGMGQGEPFLNYDNTLAALRILNDTKGIAIGARHITLSTCGIIPGIEKLSQEPEQFVLAISLHSAIQDIRDTLMPKVAHYPLCDLKRATQHYIEKTNRRVTFEYTMIQDINDTQENLACLCEFCRDMLCHVNLIPINALPHTKLRASNQAVIKHWAHTLNEAGIQTTIRQSRGADIQGACGQLKNSTAF